MEVTVLASGSSGNAFFVKTKEISFLVDCGLTKREIERRMILSGISGPPDCLFITHEHKDHVMGLDVLVKTLGCPIFSVVDFPDYKSARRIETDKVYDFGPLRFMAFATSHDTLSSGFFFSARGRNLMILTDTGTVNKQMEGLARDAHHLYLESNYDEALLAEGAYPPFLKARITSDRGHLSNDQAFSFLEAVLEGEHSLKEVCLCHLSENNNSVELVEEVFTPLKDRIPLRVCPHGELIQTAGAIKE